ncbi:MAG: stage III sporulation protein AD [Clostridia bacterium]|nr:stage III sporulation protein AD [Clostridia bacterium]
MSNEIVKAVAIIIIAAVLVTALRTRLSEYSFLLTLTVIAIVLIAVLGNLFGAVSKLRELFNQSGNAGVYFVTALKALGISYIATFAADTCRDFGLSALAQTAEIAGKITIFALSLPLMTTVLDAALKFVGL